MTKHESKGLGKCDHPYVKYLSKPKPIQTSVIGIKNGVPVTACDVAVYASLASKAVRAWEDGQKQHGPVGSTD